MTDYSWTVASALYQLRWEPTERRASAVDYLTTVIFQGDQAQVRDVAYTLLGMAGDLIAAETPPDPESPANKEIENNEYHGGFYS